MKKLHNNYIIKNSLYYKNYSAKNVMRINNTQYNLVSSSGCIINHPEFNDKYLLIVRNINYKLDRFGNSTFLKNSNNDNKTITFNKILVLNNQFNIEREYFLKTIYEQNVPYIGIEDVRFFNFNNKIYYMGSYYKNNKINIVSNIYNLNDDTLNTTIITPSFPTDYTSEKNWTFFNNNGDINVIYKWKPLYICKINYNTQKLDLIKSNNNTPTFFSKFRGSTNGIEYNNKIWFIVHYCKKLYNKNIYIHNFVVFNKQMDLIGYSNPFNFKNCIVEYCIGMTLNIKNNFVITYSLLDKTTELIVLSNVYINSLIYYI